jgi:hypothetical protein
MSTITTSFFGASGVEKPCIISLQALARQQTGGVETGTILGITKSLVSKSECLVMRPHTLESSKDFTHSKSSGVRSLRVKKSTQAAEIATEEPTVTSEHGLKNKYQALELSLEENATKLGFGPFISGKVTMPS